MAFETLLVGAVFVAGILCLTVLLARATVEQLGRILVRLDSIENELVIVRLQAGALPDEGGVAASDHPIHESGSLSKSKIKREGLEPGTPAPDFALHSLEEKDELLGPSNFRGRGFMLVLIAADCSPCESLLQKLAALSSKAGSDPFLVVARGSPERIAEKFGQLKGRFRVALEEGWAVPRAYATFRFPSAYVIDSEGVIASSIARGPEAIEMMARLFLSSAIASNAREGMYERADSVR